MYGQPIPTMKFDAQFTWHATDIAVATYLREVRRDSGSERAGGGLGGDARIGDDGKKQCAFNV